MTLTLENDLTGLGSREVDTAESKESWHELNDW